LRWILIKGSNPIKLTLAALAAAGSLSLAAYQYQPADWAGHEASFLNVRENVDGRQLLWASGPRNTQSGEWFDITGSPLEPQRYQYGIGKDSIRAIDHPEFIDIQDQEKLLEHNIYDKSLVFGYVHNEEAKAYPIMVMGRHELVNDIVGGKPVTVGW